MATISRQNRFRLVFCRLPSMPPLSRTLPHIFEAGRPRRSGRYFGDGGARLLGRASRRHPSSSLFARPYRKREDSDAEPLADPRRVRWPHSRTYRPRSRRLVFWSTDPRTVSRGETSLRSMSRRSSSFLRRDDAPHWRRIGVVLVLHGIYRPIRESHFVSLEDHHVSRSTKLKAADLSAAFKVDR